MNIASFVSSAQRVVAACVRLKSEASGFLGCLPGFSFDETMSGPITLADHPHPQHMEFRVHAEVPSLVSFLSDGRTRLTGTVSIPGFVDSAAVEGSLWILPKERVIRYEFTFHDRAGATFRFAGEKNVSPFDLVRTMTELPGFLFDAHGKEIGQAEVRFDLADLPSFLASFRPAWPT